MPKGKTDPNTELLAVRISVKLLMLLKTVSSRTSSASLPNFVRSALQSTLDPCSYAPYLRRVHPNPRGFYTHILNPEKEFVTAQAALTDYLGILELMVQQK